MYASEDSRKWDVDLQKIACSIRTVKHEILGLTPYFSLFGRNMCLCGKDYERTFIVESENEDATGGATRNERFRQLFETVRKRLEMPDGRRVERYNFRRRQQEYSLNQPVWKKNFQILDASKHFSNKLAAKYVEPFYIHKKISTDLCFPRQYW